MRKRNALAAAMAFAAMVSTPFGNAGAFDESKYPNWKGQWMRADAGAPRYDPSKPSGRGQQAPLKPEFQAVLEASLAEQRTGGQGDDPTYTCLSPGMPRVMNNYEGAEFVITPNTTHIFMEHIHDSRRIYTDGRPWPDVHRADLQRAIRSANGSMKAAAAATMCSKSRRAASRVRAPTTTPACRCIRTIKASSRSAFTRTRPIRTFSMVEITTIDNALTRPWTAIKKYRRVQNPRPVWRESVCAESNAHVEIGGQGYMLSADGFLMPAQEGPGAA